MNVRTTVSVLHLADLHFDTPFSAMSGEEASRMNADIRITFRRAMRFAAENGVDIVLIAGDLFDGEYYSAEAAELLCREMMQLPECRFVIAPGNHDPYTAGGVYGKVDFPQNCYIFSSEQMSVFSFPELNTDVYGYAFTASEYLGSPLEGFGAESRERLNLLCAHCNTPDVGQARGIPTITPEQLSLGGIDYAALGHIHTREAISRASDSLGIAASNGSEGGGSDTVYAYSGCIAGRDFGECGPKGGILVKASFTNGEKQIGAERVTFCDWIYRDASVDLSGVQDIRSAVRAAEAAVSQNGEGLTLRLRLTLKGVLAPELVNELGGTPIDRALRARLSLPDGAEIRDESAPMVELSGLEADYTLKGVFYRLLKERLSSPDPEERDRAEFALRLGLRAMDGGNPWDVN